MSESKQVELKKGDRVYWSCKLKLFYPEKIVDERVEIDLHTQIFPEYKNELLQGFKRIGNNLPFIIYEAKKKMTLKAQPK